MNDRQSFHFIRSFVRVCEHALTQCVRSFHKYEIDNRIERVDALFVLKIIVRVIHYQRLSKFSFHLFVCVYVFVCVCACMTSRSACVCAFVRSFSEV